MIGARPGDLTEGESRALAEHLATCGACQARQVEAEALSGLLSEALLAEANRRDFSSFSDEVLARIGGAGARTGAGGATAPRAGTHGPLGSLLAWIRGHRLAAGASALAPALAVLALVVYLERRPPDGAMAAVVEVSSEGRATTILETNDGPVVLLGDPEPAGS
jgi:hypothetical protein